MRDKREIKRVFEGIVGIYNNDSLGNGKPSATIQKAIDEFGKDAVRETIAVAVNHKAHDGRIYRGNKEWAANVTEMGLGDDYFLNGIDKIHPAHLDQLADAIRKYLNESAKRKTAHRAMREMVTNRNRRPLRRTRVNESMSDALEASNKNILRPEDMSFTVAVSPTYGDAMEMSRKFKDRALKAYRDVEERSKGITVPHETPILPKTNIYTGKMWRNDEPKRTNESRRNIKRMRTLAEGDLSDAAGIPGDVYAFVYDALFGFPVAKNIKALRGAKYGDYQYVTGLERTRYGKNTYDIGVYTDNKEVGRAKSIAELLNLDFHFYPRESTVFDDEGNDVTFEGIAVVEIPDSIWHTPIEDYFEQIGKKATDEVDKFRKTYYNAKAKK